MAHDRRKSYTDPIYYTDPFYYCRARALAQPDVRERLALQGYDVIAGTPAQMAAQIREDTKKWAKVIRDSGAKPE